EMKTQEQTACRKKRESGGSGERASPRRWMSLGWLCRFDRGSECDGGRLGIARAPAPHRPNQHRGGGRSEGGGCRRANEQPTAPPRPSVSANPNGSAGTSALQSVSSGAVGSVDGSRTTTRAAFRSDAATRPSPSTST